MGAERGYCRTKSHMDGWLGGCMSVWMCLMPLDSGRLKMVTVARFVLCMFYHSKQTNPHWQTSMSAWHSDL